MNVALPSPLNMMATADPLWDKDAIIYQVHVKSFFDSNNDGIGDFPGLLARLDYIASLGVNTIWLLPFYPSPRLTMVTISPIIVVFTPITERWRCQALHFAPLTSMGSVSSPNSWSIIHRISIRGFSARAGRSVAPSTATSMSGPMMTRNIRGPASSLSIPSDPIGRWIPLQDNTIGIASTPISRT